jgi:hypothetical protein
MSHVEHEVLSAEACFPAAQAAHMVWAIIGAMSPGEHNGHSDMAALSAYLPLAQAWQLKAPFDENEPAVQDLHAVAPE